LLELLYFNWAGKPEELKELLGRVKRISGGIKGVEFKGLFTPMSEWHYVLLFESPSHEKVLEVHRTYMKKYGHPPTTLGKVEILHTLEDFGITL